MLDRTTRKKLYELSVDYDMIKHPDIIHVAFFNQFQGSGKDILLNADIYNLYFEEKSVFDLCIDKVLNRPDYARKINNIYANCKLNKDVYGDDYYFISSMNDIGDARDGLMYLNDAENWFNSRGESLVKPSAKTISLVNNTRKDGLIMRISIHRYMSVDVKIRTLFPLWIFVTMNCMNNAIHKMNSYEIMYDIRNANGKKILTDRLNLLPKYAGLFDTREKTKLLTQ